MRNHDTLGAAIWLFGRCAPWDPARDPEGQDRGFVPRLRHLGARTAYLVLGLVAALVGPLLLLARRRIATAGLLEVADGTGCVGRPLGGCPGNRLA